MCGDISENPGPGKTKSATKYPCGECRKAVKNNQDAILCACCHKWSHAKCLQISPTIFRYYLDRPDLDWTCSTCALPPLSDSFFESSREEPPNEVETDSLASLTQEPIISSGVESDSLTQDPSTNNLQLENLRKHINKDILMCHININSIQNKFEELVNYKEDWRSHNIHQRNKD